MGGLWNIDSDCQEMELWMLLFTWYVLLYVSATSEHVRSSRYWTSNLMRQLTKTYFIFFMNLIPIIIGTFWFSKPVKSPEHIHAPSSHRSEEPWAEVSCWVDWIATVQTHWHSDSHDDQADAQRLHALWSTNILLVSNGQDAQDQCSGCNHLWNRSIRKSA